MVRLSDIGLRDTNRWINNTLFIHTKQTIQSIINAYFSREVFEPKNDYPHKQKAVCEVTVIRIYWVSHKTRIWVF